MMWAIVLLIGCGSTPEPAPLPPPSPNAPEVTDPGIETPPSTVTNLGRQRRRMDIGQLERSILVATDGIGWTKNNGNSKFEERLNTLGVPDYRENTIEDLTPGLVFQKFLEDAANAVCVDLVDRDKDERRVLFRSVEPETDPLGDPAALNQELARLLLRFHGREYSDDQLEPYRTLIDRSMALDSDIDQTWTTVCVALLTHPDFYTY